MRGYSDYAGVDHFGNRIGSGHEIVIPRIAPKLHHWNWRESTDGKGWRVICTRPDARRSTRFSPTLQSKRDAVAYAVAYYELDTVQVCDLVNGKKIIAKHLCGETISFEQV
jgi:hypothetical protein